MTAWRTLGALGLLLVALPPATAQTYSLAEAVKPGDCYRLHIDMKLGGEMKVNQDGQVVPLKLAATATHDFPERVLNVSDAGLPEKMARVYETAHAIIDAGSDHSERDLRQDRRLIVAQRHKDQYLVYCPAGPLLREELELASEHFDTLSLTGLLPGKAVSQGETWNVPNAVAQALCGFEGLTEQHLTCKLEEVKDNVARVSVTGTANGIDLGAQVKLTVQARYHFDLGTKRLTGVEWEQTDERDQGPASPATNVHAFTTLKRSPVEQPTNQNGQPACLDDVALVSVPDGFDVPAPLLMVSYRDPKGRYELVHGRDWEKVGQTEEHLVLRLLDQGDFVAQVTITPWTKAEKGKHLSPDEFKEAMARTAGWEMEKEVQVGEVPVPMGDKRWIYRITATGSMDGTPVYQNFYLVAGPDGDQVVLLFTMTPKKAQKLGERDLSMATSIDFPASPKEKDAGTPKKP